MKPEDQAAFDLTVQGRLSHLEADMAWVKRGIAGIIALLAANFISVAVLHLAVVIP